MSRELECGAIVLIDHRKFLLRAIAALAGIAVVALAALALLKLVLLSEDQTIATELAILDAPVSRSLPFSRYEFVCFGFRQQEFEEEGRRLGQNFFARSKCGIDNSCCNVNSDGGVVIAVVSAGAIRCVQKNPFLSVIDGDRAFCALPGRMSVRKREYVKSDSATPRYGITAPSSQYYELG